ncbi:MAG: ABC transporter permease [Chloroflexi bacterium]|nr:ABC transporter permease [Chloroflexota bacterium]
MANQTPPNNQPTEEKTGTVEIFMEELGRKPERRQSWLGRFWTSIQIPFLAILSGLLLGSVIIILTSANVYSGFRDGFLPGIKAIGNAIVGAYTPLFAGAFGSPSRIIEALRTGERIGRAFKPFTQSLVETTPYLLSGLAMALGFRAGVFNVGGEGQIYIGAVVATYVGLSFTGLPQAIHMPFAMLAGLLGGALWGFIPGWLKAKTGSHEVINTIMMNYIALRLIEYLLTGPMTRTGSGGMPISNTVEPSARIPMMFDPPITLHWGFVLSIVVAILVWFMLFKTTWGFNLQIAGANKYAAKYAGLNINLWTVMGMTLSGALAGLCGSTQVLGVTYSMGLGVSAGYGFDSIALALLANNNPLGCILSALLFGLLRTGSRTMMSNTGIPLDIVSIIQAFILMFIAAPAIIRTVYRLKGPKESDKQLVNVSNWGGN